MRLLFIQQRRAFTLVEVLISLGIISLLIAILVPSALAIRQTARTTQCADNLREILLSLNAYASLNGGAFPPNAAFPSPGQFWFDRQRAGKGLGDSMKSRPGKPGGGVLTCPNDDDGMRSYSMNIWASSQADAEITKFNPTAFWKAHVAQPSTMILVTESWSYFGTAPAYHAKVTIGENAPTAGRLFGAGGGTTPTYAGRWGWVNCDLAFNRHRGRHDGGTGTEPIGQINIGYADGHVALKSNLNLVDSVTFLSTGDSHWHPQELP